MGIGFLEDFWKYYQGFNNSKSPLKRAWSLIFRNLSQLIMLCAILLGNGSAGFKEDHGKYELFTTTTTTTYAYKWQILIRNAYLSQLGWNWPSGFGEDENMSSLQRRWKRQTNDNFWSGLKKLNSRTQLAKRHFRHISLSSPLSLRPVL